MARIRIVAALLVTLCCVACASLPAQPPQAPASDMFTQAEAMLAQARKAGAPKLAPQAWQNAQRRLLVGHNLMDRIAGERRQPTADEQRVLGWFAQAAYVNARLALVRTQQQAVKHGLDMLHRQTNASAEVSP